MTEDLLLPKSDLWIPDLTFVIFTFNEAERLPNVIKNFRAYGRILVVDNYSTDETVAIARAQGCDVLMNKNQGWVEDEETTDIIKAYVQTEWLFWGFADELLATDTLAEMARVIGQDRADVIVILRKNYLYGVFCHDVAISYQTKVFKKNAVDFRGNTIHNFGKIVVAADRVYQMPPDKFVHHLISNTAASYLNTINRYSDAEVSMGTAHGKRRALLYYLLLPLKAIWGDYFFRGGRKTGQPALTLSALVMIYSLVTAMKAWEQQQGFDQECIAERYRQVADALLQGLGE